MLNKLTAILIPTKLGDWTSTERIFRALPCAPDRTSLKYNIVSMRRHVRNGVLAFRSVFFETSVQIRHAKLGQIWPTASDRPKQSGPIGMLFSTGPAHRCGPGLGVELVPADRNRLLCVIVGHVHPPRVLHWMKHVTRVRSCIGRGNWAGARPGPSAPPSLPASAPPGAARGRRLWPAPSGVQLAIQQVGK
jgi:hypothetical protein